MRTWLEPGGALCVLDLEPMLGVQLAARLADVAHPVLVLPRWPYAEAVLATGHLKAVLLDEARRLPSGEQRLSSVVFVLDALRSAPIRRRRADRRADNRYTLAVADLPDLRTLRQRGIRRIHQVRPA
jgi:hypothetical protein